MAQQDIQKSINAAAEQLAQAFNNNKAAKQGLKELKAALKEKLESLPQYQDLLRREKELKKARTDLSEEIQDIKKTKEQMSLETDEQKEMDDFVDDQEVKFSKVKDTVIAQLSRDLADNGMVAEIQYKSGQLILIVARA